MEILAIASAILFVKVILCCTLLRNCKTTEEKVKKIIVNIGEKICKESTDLTIKPVVKKTAPPKPPRGVKQSTKKSSDNSNLQKNISANVHSETFCNNDYIRSKVYVKHYCNQCHRISSEKEARFREASVQSERPSKDTLLVSIKPQEQIPSSGNDTDSSKSVPQISELKTIQFKIMTNSLESRNSQHCSREINIVNDETIFVNLPNKMYKEIEKNPIYPLTSTKIQPKKSPFHKLRKYFVARLHRIFRLKN